MNKYHAKKTEYNLGQDIPIKFQLKDANGNYISDAESRIYIAQIIDGEIQPEQPAVFSGKANTDNIARYDADKDQYIFNLSTKDLFPGQYQIRADTGDESMRTIDISLEKSGDKGKFSFLFKIFVFFKRLLGSLAGIG